MSEKTKIIFATHGYFFLTLIGLLFFILFIFLPIIVMFGCHTTLYLFAASFVVGDLGANTLAHVFFRLWPVYVVALLICYLIAVIAKKYIPLAIIASIDVLFSCFISLHFLRIFALPHFVASLVGLVFSFLTAKWLFQANKQ